jgi:Polyketide cyclase / dehydrase and lipid transport
MGRRTEMTGRTSGRTNALTREIVVDVEATTRASADTVFDVLTDLRSHLDWGGERQRKKTRLTSLDAAPGEAVVGTEFRTSGNDPMGTFQDASVVTEATRPTVFEFVTEARQELKNGRTVEWTNVHRYEIEPTETGCTIRYSFHVLRLSKLAGMLTAFRVPGLSAVLRAVWRALIKRGLRNLARAAEERVQAR